MTGTVEVGLTIALNCCNPPRSILKGPLGNSTVVGVGKGGLVLLPPPHPFIAPKEKARYKDANTPKTNRRMHPPRPSCPWHAPDESLFMLENDQCRGEPLIWARAAPVTTPALGCGNGLLTMCFVACYI